MKDIEPIDAAELESINGGNRGRAIAQGVKTAASWAWRNVIAPAGGGALYEWATGGNRNQNQNQNQNPPAQQPPAGQ